MGKYGKKFRKVQLEEWKEKYFNYKRFKQLIKSFLSEKNKIQKVEEILTPIDEMDNLNKNITTFTDELDKEIKKFYVFFTNKEKKLYKDINKYLHQKDDYPEFDLSEYLVHFNQLYELSKYNFNLAVFVYYNLKAVLKILKKFDKKVIGPEDKSSHILFNYIQTKLEQQNSDILYLFRFKMIDEVNVLMENLVKYLRECLKSNKKQFKEKEINEDNNIINDEDNKEKLVNNKNLTYNEVSNIIDGLYKKVQKNMTDIDLIAMSTIKMFKPWKEFLRISSDVSSKLMQMNKEFSFSDRSFGEERKYSRSISITDNIYFSKENKFNIVLTLSHGFLYTFSYAVIIPTYIAYIDFFKKDDFDIKHLYGLLMMMAPLGALIGYSYETKFFKYSTKIPYIISISELFIGNLFYLLAGVTDIYIFLFVGRFLVGLSNLRSHNKMYIINYLSRKDTNFYLTMFHAFSILGLFSGFIINAFYNEDTFKNLNKNIYLNEKTLGCFIVFLISIIFLFLLIFLYSEAHSKKFNKLSVSQIDRNIEPGQNNPVSINTSDERDSQNQIDVQKDSNMIENLDAQLEDFNKQNKYDDTNLVSRSISEITNQEKENLSMLKKAFYVYLFIIFTTKFINESMIIYFGLNLMKISNDTSMKELQHFQALVLGCSYIMILVLEFALSKKIECTRDKIFLIIILSMNLINNSLLIYFAQQNYKILIINTSLAIIVSNLIQKTSSHYFFNIIPNQYILCGIQGNVLINILSTIGRISSCGLLIMYKRNEEKEIMKNYFDIIYYSIMTFFSLISLLLYWIFYSDIREKAISRIIKNTNKKEVKIATEV